MMSHAVSRTNEAKLQPQGPGSSDVRQALIASGLFSRTSTDAVEALSKQVKSEQFTARCVVGTHGDFGGRTYVIISGKVMVSYRRPDGCEVVLKILGPGEIFGAITLFDPDSQETSVTTLTEVGAVRIERDQLLRWMAELPEVSDQVLRLFARWANAATNRFIDFAYADAQERIASRLLFLRRRFGRREGDVVRVVHDLTLKDFSLLAGVPAKAIVATLRDFADRGWIRLEDDSVLIVDGQALASVGPTTMSEVSCA
jgi:CRP/FNR family cyclic AMP-dependent transcriptional regulator